MPRESVLRAFVVLTALALAACGGNKPADKPSEAASASPAAPVVPAAICTAGKMPITGVCDDAQPALFGFVDPKPEMYSDKCTWVTAEAQRSDTEALVFRVQKCPAGSEPMTTYKFDGPGKLMAYFPNPEPGKPPYDNLAAEIWDLKAGETAQDVAMKTLAGVPKAESKGCEIHMKPEIKFVAGQAFEVGPTDARLKELHTVEDGILSTCGSYGYSEEAVAFWEARPAYAIYHSLGQDTPPWDPASFTFYKKQADGSWQKQ